MSVSRSSVFEYLYRDAGNFKAWGALLLRGALTEIQVGEMCSKFEGGEFFIAEQIGVPPLYQELWDCSNGPTDSDHVWHEFFALRPAEESDSAMGALWGTANGLFKAVLRIAQWNECLSPHRKIQRRVLIGL